ncbi:hypothetical protein ACFLVV_00740 [Chloroflexota bacterium]
MGNISVVSQKDGTLVWADPQDWSTAVRRFLRDRLPDNIRSAIEAGPEMYFYTDDTKWEGDRLVRCRDNQEIPGLRDLLQEFQQTYSKVIMFHGCRTEDVGSYLRDGFLPLDVDKQMQKARDLFLTDRYPQITEGQFSAAASECNDVYRQQGIFFSLDETVLINWSGHYLVYGSEYLQCVAAELTRATGVECEETLRNIGVPTMFVCDVPLSLIQRDRMWHLLVELIRLEPYAAGEERPSIDFTFKFAGPIPADVIRSHYHPTCIWDQSDSKMYRHNDSFCPFCNRNP